MLLRNRLLSSTGLLGEGFEPRSNCFMPDDVGGGASAPAAPSAPSSAPASGGGGTVAPGVEPPPGAPGSTVPSTTVPGAEGAEPPDFISIFDGPPVEVVSPPAPPAPTPEPAAAPAQPVTPAVVAPPAVPAAAGPGEGGQQPAVPTQPPGQSPVLDPYDPSGLAIAIQQNEQATIDYVAQSMFALTQEDLQALEADVGGTVPKLLAKAFVKTQVNSLMQLARIIPEMVKRSTENMRNHTQNEDAFYKAWPQIDKTKHADIVKRYGITYRTMNPQVTKEQMIADLGPLVMMAARIPATATPTVPVQPAQNGAALAAHQPSPFSPAISGPAATVSTPELSDVEAMFAPRD